MSAENPTSIKFSRFEGKPKAVATTRALHMQMEDHLAANPVIDKDAVESQIEAITSELGRRKSNGLVNRLRDGNPVTTARAQTEADQIINPSPAPTSPEFTYHMLPQIIPAKDVKDRVNPLRRRWDRTVGRVTRLYTHVASGRIIGLSNRDVDSLMQRLTELDLRDYLAREQTFREIDDITIPLNKRMME